MRKPGIKLSKGIKLQFSIFTALKVHYIRTCICIPVSTKRNTPLDIYSICSTGHVLVDYAGHWSKPSSLHPEVMVIAGILDSNNDDDMMILTIIFG